MAVNARELLLIVRAQNQASGALRRVGRDLGSLGNIRAAKMRAEGQRIVNERLRASQQLSRNELTSLTNGKKYIELQKSMASNAIAMKNAELARSRVAGQQNILQARMLENEARRGSLTRRIQYTSKLPGGASSGYLRDLQRQFTAASIRAKELQVEEGRLAEKMNIATGSITKQKLALQELTARQAAAAERAGYLQAKINTQASALALGAAKHREYLKAISDERWNRVGRIGSAIQHTGRVAQYAGLVMGGSLAYAAHSAARFNTEATLAATQTRGLGASAEQTAKHAMTLQKQILALMREFPATQDDISKSAYDLYSSTDVSFKGGAKALRLFAQAAVAGGTTVQEATDAGITVLNNFGKSVDTLPVRLERMFAAVRFGRMTFSNFASSVSTIGPAARAAGQSFDDMAGAFAFLTRHLNLGQARTGYARVLEILSGNKMQKGLEKLHVNITRTVNGVKQLKPLDQVIGTLIQKFPYLEKGGIKTQNFFKDIANQQGTIQARRAFTYLTQFFSKAGKDGASYQDMLRHVKGDNTEFTRSLQAMEKTTGVRWDVFVNNLRALALEIGTAVIPVIIRLGKPLSDVVKWFNGLDAATKKQYATWAAWAAAIVLASSVVLFLGGTLIKILALFGRLGGAFGVTIATIAIVATAVGLLTGNWRSLNDAVDGFVNLGTGSLVGWVTMLGLAAVAAIKLSRAMRGIAIASAATGSGQAVGGIGGLIAGGRNLKAGMSLTRDAIRTKGLISGIAASSALIPGSVLLAVGAIGLAAGAALLWKRHMEGVKKTQDEINAATARNQAFFAKPGQAATRFGGMATDVGDVVKARQQLDQLRKARDEAQRIFNKAPTKSNNLNLQSANIDVARSIDALNAANYKANRSFNALSQSIRAYEAAAVDIASKQNLVKSWRAQRAEYQRLDMAFMQAGGNRVYGRQIEDLTRRIDLMTHTTLPNAKRALADTLVTLRSSLNKNLTQLSNARLIPKIDQGQIRLLESISVRMRRALTQKEIVMLVKAQLDPSAIRKLPIALRRAYAIANKQMLIDAGKGSVLNIKPKIQQSAMQNFIKSTQGKWGAVKILTHAMPPSNQKKVKATVANFFSKPIRQPIHIGPIRPNMESVGADIDAGIARGITANSGMLNSAVAGIIANAKAAAKSAAEARSPSKLFAREVGVPIVQGIILGIVKSQNQLNKAATLSMQILAGTYIQARQQAIDSYDAAEVKKAQNKIAKDSALIDKLAGSLKKAKGAQAEYTKARIASLRTDIEEQKLKTIKPGPMTVLDLIKDTQGQAKSFKQFNDAISRLQKRGVPRQLLDDLRALGVDGLKYIQLLASASPKELRRFVAAYTRAQKQIKASTTSSVQDLKDWRQATAEQLKGIKDDAATKLLDTWNGFRDQMVSAFGSLFGGPTGLGDKIGQAFKDAHDSWQQNVDDLKTQLKDLNSQIVDLNNQAAQQLADAIAARRDELQNSFGSIFDGSWLKSADIQTKVDWGIALGFDDLQKDLQSQVDRFRHWRDTLTSLASKVPADLAKQLEALGPDAIAMLDILNNGTADQIAQYIKTWQEGQAAIMGVANQTTVDTSAITSQIADILKQIDEVTAKLAAATEPKPLTPADIIDDLTKQKQAFVDWQATLDALRKKNLPTALLEQLAALGPDAEPYLLALNQMTTAQLFGKGGFVDTWQTSQQAITTATNAMMNDQLKMWEAHGANIATAIIAGVQSEQQALLNYFRNLFVNLLTGKTTTTGSGPGGADTIRDAQGGYGDKNTTLSYSTPTSGDNVSMVVYATQDETLSAALNRARFQLQNRKKP